MIKVSAPAKIHLIGEYSAVLGKPAILFPINLSLTVTIQKTRAKVKKEPFQKAIELEITKRFKIKIPNYSLKINSNIPTGSGLGSSAALSASLTQALLKLINIKASQDEIFQIALVGEKVFHGFPSGSDLWTILLGKPLWYRKETEDLLIVKPLDFPIHRNIKLFLIDSGKPAETTKQMVISFKKIDSKHLKEFSDSQEELTKNMLPVLRRGNQKELLNILRKAGQNLEKLGVVSKKAQEIIRRVEQIGGAAKITGAGGIKEGAGMLIAFHKNPKKLRQLAKKNSWNIIPIQ